VEIYLQGDTLEVEREREKERSREVREEGN